MIKKLIASSLSTGTFLFAASSAFAEEISISIPPPPSLKVTDFGKLLSGAVGLILVLAALAAFIYLIWGGINWITSGGDKAAVESAQHRIQAALIGLFVVFATWAIFLIIEQFFGISILRGIKLPTGF